MNELSVDGHVQQLKLGKNGLPRLPYQRNMPLKTWRSVSLLKELLCSF